MSSGPGRLRPLRDTLLSEERVSEERGASLALVALSLVWMVGLAALVVDVGGGWLDRQTLIPATDAAALAAAQDLVAAPGNHGGACQTAADYVSANAPDATMTSCDVTAVGNGGRVSIAASTVFESNFLQSDSAVNSVGSGSTAAWGPPLTIRGLRPIALCYDGSAALKQVIDHPPSGQAWVRINYTKDDPSDCGGPDALGNFATIDFAAGSSTAQIEDWMLNGYQSDVALDSAAIGDCSGPATCYNRPYASGDIQEELNTLRSNWTYVPIPVFNYADTDKVHLVGVVRARFYDFQLGGFPDSWWIELKVEPGLLAGTCCGPAALTGKNKVIAICGVDPGAFDSCAPKAGS